MNFIKNQKSDEGFNEDRHSASSGSRRVMWKLSDDEETFDSVVNYRRMTYQRNLSNDAVAETSAAAADAVPPSTNKDDEDGKSVSNNSRSGSDAWTYIFNLIKANKLSEELAQPAALALRYKPSKESLKNKRSKEKHVQQQQLASDKPNRKLMITECCALPPHQCAVIEELPPKFSQLCTNDSDSSDNGEISKAAASIIASIVASKTEPNARMSAENAKSPGSSMDALLPLPPPASPLPTQSNRTTTKRKMQPAKTTKATNSSQKLPNNNVAATNTFRQRQLELHRYRLQVEQRRLELLDLKIAREREEAVRQQILFQKDLEFKSTQIKQVMDDMTSI